MNATISFIATRLEYSNSDRGISSEAMLRQALGGTPVRWEWESPLDWEDLGRCWRTYRKAPRRLRRKMRPTLHEYRRFVIERQGERRRA